MNDGVFVNKKPLTIGIFAKKAIVCSIKQCCFHGNHGVYFGWRSSRQSLQFPPKKIQQGYFVPPQ